MRLCQLCGCENILAAESVVKQCPLSSARGKQGEEEALRPRPQPIQLLTQLLIIDEFSNFSTQSPRYRDMR